MPLNKQGIRGRDSQRSRVYKAEDTCSFGKKLTTVKECQAFYDRITDQKWFTDRFGEVFVTVMDGRGRKHAAAFPYTGEIWLPRWARNELIMLHELAHLCVNKSGSKAAWHGKEFCAAYMTLVRRYMGIRAWRELGSAFREGNVDF